MNDKQLNRYREQGMSENRVFDAFFSSKPSEYAVLSDDEKTELNRWIQECNDENNRRIS